VGGHVLGSGRPRREEGKGGSMRSKGQKCKLQRRIAWMESNTGRGGGRERGGDKGGGGRPKYFGDTERREKLR